MKKLECAIVLFFVLLISFSSCKQSEEKVEFYENGNKKIEYTLVEGHKEGEEKEYYEVRTVKSITIYKDGLRNGVFKKFYENGNHLALIEYFNDLKEGEELFYFPDGKLATVSSFHNNKLHGILKAFYPDGRLAEKNFYKNDKLYYSEIYNGSPSLIEKKYFPIIYPVNDTSILGSKVEFKMEFIDPKFDSLSVLIGGLDSSHRLIDTISIITSLRDNVSYTFTGNKPGVNILSGYIIGANRKKNKIKQVSFSEKYFIKR